MDLYKFKILSRYPEICQDGKQYYKFPQILSLRFQINPIIKVTSIKITNNGKPVVEKRLDEIAPQLQENRYFNFWMNLGVEALPRNKLKIFFKVFGFYIPIKTLNYLMLDTSEKERYSGSDSYIDASLLSNPNISGEQLEAEIMALPSPVRATSSGQIRKEIRSIILLRLDQLGDFVLTVSAISEIKALFPEANITGLVSPSNEDLAKSTGLFDDIITVKFSFAENTNHRELTNEAKGDIQIKVGSRHYDIAVDLSPMPESREILGLISATRKFGFENTDTSMLDFGLLIHAKDPINCLSNITHAAYPLLLVDAVRRALKPNFYHVPKTNNAELLMNRMDLICQKYIIVHSGSRNLLVRWPLVNFIDLTRRIVESGIKVVFFSDEKLSEISTKSFAAIRNCIVVDGRINFDDFDTIISNARIFIGNDSGPKHLAAMRGIPTISIHSPRTNWSEWGQIDSGYIVSRRVPCAGCAIITEDECARQLQCIRSITLEEVYKSVNELL